MHMFMLIFKEIYVYCLRVYLCPTIVQNPQRPEVIVRSPGIDVADGCAPSCGFGDGTKISGRAACIPK